MKAWFGALALTLPLAAQAGCSRPIQAPVAALGQTVNVKGADISGIYPDLLRAAAARSGCEMRFSVVLRNTQQTLYETGKADVLAPALRTARRDRLGTFVPVIQVRPMLITVDASHLPVSSLDQLVNFTKLRLAVIRGNDLGSAYQAAVDALQAARRAELVDDPITAARLIQSGYVDGIIISPTTWSSAILSDPRVAGLHSRLRLQALDEVPWTESGIYLSHVALTSSDRLLLEQAIREVARTSSVWNNYKRYADPKMLNESVRPLR